MRGCDACPGIRLAFEFLVLTATRSGEGRNARWPEIDRDGAVWTIPAARMKNGREHRVPLADRALEVLDEARELAAALRAPTLWDGPDSRVPQRRGGVSAEPRRISRAAPPRAWSPPCASAACALR